MPARREYPERPIIGVGGVVISGGRVLLVRRGSPPLQDQWSIPGGILEIGETLTQGVRRELVEETGIDVQVRTLIDVFERIDRDPSGKSQYHFVVLDYFCEAVRGTARAGSDVTEIAWAAPSELGKYTLTEIASRVIRKAFELVGEGR